MTCLLDSLERRQNEIGFQAGVVIGKTDIDTVHLCHGSHQAQPKTTSGCAAAVIQTEKFLEDVIVGLGRNTRTRIGNDDVGGEEYSVIPMVPDACKSLLDSNTKFWAARLGATDGKVTAIKTTTAALLFPDRTDTDGIKCVAVMAPTITEAVKKAEEA